MAEKFSMESQVDAYPPRKLLSAWKGLSLQQFALLLCQF